LITCTPKKILSDILLPDISGYEICKTIKLNNKLKDIPIFYITAVTEPEVSQKLKETGAEGYFTKPFDLTEFIVLFDYLKLEMGKEK
jgi:CheY-like chemotaxis protein